VWIEEELFSKVIGELFNSKSSPSVCGSSLSAYHDESKQCCSLLRCSGKFPLTFFAALSFHLIPRPLISSWSLSESVLAFFNSVFSHGGRVSFAVKSPSSDPWTWACWWRLVKAGSCLSNMDSSLPRCLSVCANSDALSQSLILFWEFLRVF